MTQPYTGRQPIFMHTAFENVADWATQLIYKILLLYNKLHDWGNAPGSGMVAVVPPLHPTPPTYPHTSAWQLSDVIHGKNTKRWKLAVSLFTFHFSLFCVLHSCNLLCAFLHWWPSKRRQWEENGGNIETVNSYFISFQIGNVRPRDEQTWALSFTTTYKQYSWQLMFVHPYRLVGLTNYWWQGCNSMELSHDGIVCML